MKHIILILCIAFAACTSEPKPPAATFVSVETPLTKAPQRAYNVGQTAHGVSAYYADADAEFVLYFNQCCVLAFDGKVLRLDCPVYQEQPGVWVAELPGGFVRINSQTGTTTVQYEGVNRVYHKEKTP